MNEILGPIETEILPADPVERRRTQNRNARRKYRSLHLINAVDLFDSN